jgi:amino acid permease
MISISSSVLGCLVDWLAWLARLLYMFVLFILSWAYIVYYRPAIDLISLLDWLGGNF